MAAIDAEMVETIRRIYRSTHILVSLKRDKMSAEGRSGDMEELIRSTREAQQRLLRQASG